MNLTILLLITLILSTGGGYLRAPMKRFSFYWFLFIHLPVPFIIISRYLLDVPHGWISTSISVAIFFAGQKVGVYLKQQKS